MVHRRDVLIQSAAALGALTLPRMGRAEVSVGDGRLITVSDGHLDLPKDFILGPLSAEIADPILARHEQTGDRLRQPCNVTLYQDADRTVLFDVGSGSDFVPTAGTLLDGLEAAGVMPDDVTDVVFTHGHPDHLWGLLDDFDDPAFPDARFHIGRIERDYWVDPATADEIGEARQSFAVGAKRRLDRIADQIMAFDDGDEVLPGITALATFGHTPGHMAFEVGAKDPVFVIGDAIGNAHVSFVNPAWELGSDQDPKAAATTRAALVNRLATSGHRVAGFHLPGGGLGRIETTSDGYRFVGETL